MARFIALLRGINVGGSTSFPMSELRTLCSTLGWRDVQTYIQSGNVVFDATGTPAALAAALSQAIARERGRETAVVVRKAAAWSKYIDGNPFPDASASTPNLVMLCLSNGKPKASMASELEAKGTSGERVAVVGDALWIHYAGGAGRSKLTPAVLERAVGAPVTARNWNTVLKLQELAAR